MRRRQLLVLNTLGVVSLSVSFSACWSLSGNVAKKIEATASNPRSPSGSGNGIHLSPGMQVINPRLVSTSSFEAQGGAGHKTFSVVSGPGTIGGATGDFTPDQNANRVTTTVQVSDSAANIATAKVFHISPRFNAEVSAIAIPGNGFGYFGGGFTSYGGHLLNGIGKLNGSTGNLEPGCNLAGLLGAYAIVSAVVETETAVFVGGSFTRFAERWVQNVVKVDKAKCALDTTFTQATGFNGSVNALGVSGTSLYVGGVFTTYRGAPAGKLAKLDLTTGVLDTSFTLATGFDGGGVYALAIDGTSLYVGGGFTSYRGASAKGLAKVDLATGVLDTSFTQTNGFIGGVVALGISGTSLYAGGNFTTYRGAPAGKLAKLDLTTGVLDAAFTQATGFEGGNVNTLAVSGTSLYAGGSFTTYRGAPATRIAKVDLATGVLDPAFTQPTGFDSNVIALGVSGTSLYVGGYFTTYRGAPATRLAKIDLTTGGLDTTFNQSMVFGATANIKAIVVSGASLYVGGPLESFQGTPVERIAKVDLSTGALDTAFTQAAGFNGSVLAFAVAGTSLYVGGNFTSYRGASAKGLAKVDLATGVLDTSFTLATGFDGGGVYALAIDGTSLYVGGGFTSYRGASAKGLAKVDLATGVLDTSFTQTNGFIGGVVALGISGTSLYAGGNFTTYRGAPAGKLAKLDLTTGVLDAAFTQATGFEGGNVNTLAVSGASLYAGGAFTSYRGGPANGIAKVSLATGDLDVSFTQGGGFNGQVKALAVYGTSLYACGIFSSYRMVPAGMIAKLNAADGSLDTGFTHSQGFGASALALVVSGNVLWVGGHFSNYRGSDSEKTMLRAGGLDLTTGDPNSF